MKRKNILTLLLMGSLLLAPAIGPRAAEGSQAGVVVTATEPGTGISGMFGVTDGEHDNNSWVFVGGSDVAAGFDEIRGARNYIGHFEEFVRGTRYDDNSTGSWNGRHRHTINMGKAGRTLDQIVNDYENLVNKYDPKAAVYLVSPEDYNAASEGDFKADLKSFIDKSLALRGGKGFAVIQKPFKVKEAATNTKIDSFADAVDAVVAEYAQDSGKYSRIVVVDHDEQTAASANATWVSGKLDADGVSLNKDGHLEIAKQLAEATIGGTNTNWPSRRPNMLFQLTEEDQPDQYLKDVQPTVTSGADSLSVAIDQGQGSEWSYELDMEGTIVSGTSDAASFTIDGLTEGKEYILKICSQDGTKQLQTVKGKIEDGQRAVKNTPVLDRRQQLLADKMEADSSLTWLFMGDSITHGLQWTDGYDSYSQLFEKYIREDLGRPDDTVINTAVSSANTETTLDDIEFRLEKYAPDVVVMMLGTNDAAFIANTNEISHKEYEVNMQEILDRIKASNPEAMTICLEPVYTWHSYYNRTPNLPGYVARMRKVMEANPDVIVVEQYEQGSQLFNSYKWLKTSGVLYPDALHPNGIGHLIMFRNLVRGAGLWTEDSPISNLWYKTGITEEAVSADPTIDSTVPGQLSLSIKKLEGESGKDLGDVTIKATNASGQSYAATGKEKDGEVVLKNLPAGTYTVSVSGHLVDSAKKVTFTQKADVEVTAGTQAVEALSVEARYSSNHIRFADVPGAVGYYVTRSAAQEGTYQRLQAEPIRDVWGQDEYDYIDEGAGTGTQYYYKIESVTASGGTSFGEAVQDQYKTGIEAVQKHASEQYHLDLTQDAQGMDFASRIVEGSTEEAEAVNALREGMIFITFKPSNVSGRKVLLALKDSDATTAQSGNNNSAGNVAIFQDNASIRMDFGTATTMKASLQGNPIAANAWSTYAYKASDLEPGEYNVTNSVNGATYGGWNDDSLAGFMEEAGVMDTLSVGSVKNSGTQALNFAGQIAYVTVTDEVFSEREMNEYTRALTKQMLASQDMAITDLMSNSFFDDNSWVFTGGGAVEGGFSQIRGVRNYIGQFEECIRRWVAGRNENQMQRYTINSGKEGRGLGDVVANYEELVAKFSPRVAVYLVGREDYEKGEAGLTQFKADLKDFIDKTLALKAGDQSFAVIQKPFASSDAADNAMIKKYSDAVDEVKADYANNKSVVIVDHYSQTNSNTSFKSNMLTETGVLNADGHHEIGRQLVQAVMGSTANYPSAAVTKARQEEAQPSNYPEVLPTATAADSSLEVVVPDGNGNAWNYELDMEGTVVRGEAEASSFEIPGLANGKNYILRLTSADGTTRLKTVMGSITAGNTATAYSLGLDGQQQKLDDLLAAKGEDGMTWLFMGDSITHGAIATSGYDSLPQLFEKYVRGELGRAQDTVVNTAVYGTDTKKTMANIAQRMEKYRPDVVALMLGTNDAKPSLNIGIDAFEDNIEAMIAGIRKVNPDAVIILRSLILTWDTNHAANVPAYSERLREIAEEDGDILFIDQMTWTTEYMTDYTWLRTGGGDYMYFDALHPDGNGHLLLFRQFLRETGLWEEDTSMTNLRYTMPVTAEENATMPQLTKDGGSGSVSLSIAGLKTASGLDDLGAVALKATVKQTGQSFETAVEDGAETITLSGLSVDCDYEVEVVGWRKTQAQKVTFALQDVNLSTQEGADFDILLSSTEAAGLAAGSTVGELSVSAGAPEGSYTYSLVAGVGSDDNSKFSIEGTTLKTAEALQKGGTYSIRIKAVNGVLEKEKAFTIRAVGTPVSLDGLQALITEAEKQVEADYTAESWATFAEALAQAKEVVENSGNASQDDIDTAKNGLEAALNGLQKKPGVKERVAAPTFSVEPGTYTEAKTVELSTATAGADIYYTTDGKAPGTSSTKYSKAITVDKTMTIKAIAVKEGMEDSTVATAEYTINIPSGPDPVVGTVEAPAFSVAAGTYNEAQSVELSTKTAGAAIYYTTDGTAPTTSSTKYSRAITVDKTMTIKAIAVKAGMKDSAVATAAYTINTNIKGDKPWIFTDVDQIPGHWKYESVRYVYNNDIMGAITGTTLFQPDRPLDRAMFATVLYRMAGSPAVTFEDKFSDVEEGKWYSNAIIWANQNKIVDGYLDGSYGITRNITREQIAKMLFEYARVKGYDNSARKALTDFTDEKEVSGWAVEYMQWATAVEMITGKPNDPAQTSFRMDPKGEATRAECAAMLTRFANQYEK